jgi:hypothetical protein
MPPLLQLVPEGGPEPVRAAHEAMRVLAEALTGDGEQLASARANKTAAERALREADAREMRSGVEQPVSDTRPLDQAQADELSARRRQEARRLALADCEAEYREVFEAHRGQWRASASRAAGKVLTHTERTLGQLVSDVAALGEALALVHWLTPPNGLDQGQPLRPVGLGLARSSAHSQANSQALGTSQLLDWLGEAIQRTRELSAAEPTPEPQTPEPVSTAG